MTTMLKKEIVISADDLTGKAFAGIEKRIDALSKASKRLNGGVAGKLDLISGMPNFGYDKNLKSIAGMISRMSLVSSGAEKASSSLSGLGRSLSGLTTVIAPFLALKVKDFAGDVIHTFREFDDARRYQKAILGISDEQQKPLVDQAIHLGGTTKFNDIQVLEAQLSLAQHGIKAEMIIPMINFAAQFGQAMNVDLPTAAKALETTIFSTAQNMDDAATAMKTAQHVTDIMVKTAKIGGLDAEGVQQYWKFGGASGHVAGLSLETMGAMAAMMSRGGIRGDEGGVALRSIAGSLVSPTTKGMIALNAMGIDFSKYADMSKVMRPENLELATKRELGIRFSDKQKKNIQDIMRNPETRDNQADFVKAIVDEFPDMSKLEAKQMAQVAKKFWKSSTESVDVEGLLREIIKRHPTASQSNDLFTKQQGGRFEVIAQRGLEEFLNFRDQLAHVQEGFTGIIGDERTAGFSGAMSRLEGSTKNLETAFGRADDFFITPMTDKGAHLIQTIAEMDAATHLMIQALGGTTAAIIALGLASKAGAIFNGAAATSGAAGGAAAVAGAGLGWLGGAAGTLSRVLGWGAGVAGLGYIGKTAYDLYNSIPGDGSGVGLDSVGRLIDLPKAGAGGGEYSAPVPYFGLSHLDFPTVAPGGGEHSAPVPYFGLSHLDFPTVAPGGGEHSAPVPYFGLSHLDFPTVPPGAGEHSTPVPYFGLSHIDFPTAAAGGGEHHAVDQYFGHGPVSPLGGREHITRLDGAAQISVRIEVSADNETVIRQVLQTIDARGNLRADTGRSMPEATPGASRGE